MEELVQKDRRREALAAKVMDLARSTLMVEFRFLQRGLHALTPVPYEGENGILFAADGVRLHYDPAYVLELYRGDWNMPARCLLHSLLHCVFRHGMTGGDLQRELWDLACDISVEHTINSLGSFSLKVPLQGSQSAMTGLLRQELNYLTAEKIYGWLRDRGVTPEEAEKEREHFKLDQHSLWPGRGEAKPDEAVELIRRWTELSKKMQTELETFSSASEVLAANLQNVNRTRRSYAAFLRSFGRQGEVMRLSEEEFDTGYYSYGLRLYGNVPLVEPLEYREQKKIRSFVIAIDTSGSVQGEAVRSFVQRTYDLIMSAESFDTRVRLHILQADDRVREDALVTSPEEFERYLSRMQILGLGKTDFRPVFTYVDQLVREGQLPSLAGLLYFTDGQGIFPVRRPSYPAAFIIRTEEVYPPEVPPWAMRMILEDDDLEPAT